MKAGPPRIARLQRRLQFLWTSLAVRSAFLSREPLRLATIPRLGSCKRAANSMGVQDFSLRDLQRGTYHGC